MTRFHMLRISAVLAYFNIPMLVKSAQGCRKLRRPFTLLRVAFRDSLRELVFCRNHVFIHAARHVQATTVIRQQETVTFSHGTVAFR